MNGPKNGHVKPPSKPLINSEGYGKGGEFKEPNVCESKKRERVFDWLPDDKLPRIWGFLTSRDVLEVRKVCKRFEVSATDKKGVMVRLVSTDFENTEKSERIKFAEARGISAKVTLESLSDVYKFIEFLTFHKYHDVKKNIREIELPEINNSRMEDLGGILLICAKLCPNLETLHLKELHASFTFPGQLNGLKRLHIKKIPRGCRFRFPKKMNALEYLKIENISDTTVKLPKEMNALERMEIGYIYGTILEFPKKLNALKQLIFGQILNHTVLKLPKERKELIEASVKMNFEKDLKKPLKDLKDEAEERAKERTEEIKKQEEDLKKEKAK